jgi:hypothetical protein
MALDEMGAAVVKPEPDSDGSEGNGCAGFPGRAVAGVDVAPTGFGSAAVVPVGGFSSAGSFASLVATLWATCLVSVDGPSGAFRPASAMGLEPGFVSPTEVRGIVLEPGFESATAAGGEVAGNDAAGFSNWEPFSSATDSAFEPVGGAGPGAGADA